MDSPPGAALGLAEGELRWGTPQCARLWLAHEPSALWKNSGGKPLLCEHNAAFRLNFSALLFAFVDIIPHFSCLFDMGGKKNY